MRQALASLGYQAFFQEQHKHPQNIGEAGARLRLWECGQASGAGGAEEQQGGCGQKELGQPVGGKCSWRDSSGQQGQSVRALLATWSQKKDVTPSLWSPLSSSVKRDCQYLPVMLSICLLGPLTLSIRK